MSEKHLLVQSEGAGHGMEIDSISSGSPASPSPLGAQPMQLNGCRSFRSMLGSPDISLANNAYWGIPSRRWDANAWKSSVQVMCDITAFAELSYLLVRGHGSLVNFNESL